MGFETSTGRAELPVEALMFMGRNGKDCEWSLWTLWGSRDISGPLSLLFEETAGIFFSLSLRSCSYKGHIIPRGKGNRICTSYPESAQATGLC